MSDSQSLNAWMFREWLTANKDNWAWKCGLDDLDGDRMLIRDDLFAHVANSRQTWLLEAIMREVLGDDVATAWLDGRADHKFTELGFQRCQSCQVCAVDDIASTGTGWKLCPGCVKLFEPLQNFPKVLNEMEPRHTCQLGRGLLMSAERSRREEVRQRAKQSLIKYLRGGDGAKPKAKTKEQQDRERELHEDDYDKWSQNATADELRKGPGSWW